MAGFDIFGLPRLTAPVNERGNKNQKEAIEDGEVWL